ncbi:MULTISPECIES: hypothetical protein [Bradyrhizobium]|uniref:hypothetical protein n=1 Tax=Bradyrhizobium TaxID=374 RepID=UPI001CE2D4A1|nr:MULTISPECIES: hypothetical protein [Bradyrhizobium]WLC10797.1 hypothetical protein QIH86_15895 [Bradyrhizobium elkanii USDA 94]MCP1903578.1 hypothetical protein [Bradyrhizobium sp. USDA 4537]MCP1990765.1 hypothetical protein [Bradyrhizobium sp. USDA 4539]MCP3413783.1 hypothetical protein [Bradyrhizobium brasilense]MCS3557789.1 hypothetical protein [Bradyrhizobium elkanii]
MRNTDSLLFENNGAPEVRSMGDAPVIVIQTDCVAFNRPASTADADKAIDQ